MLRKNVVIILLIVVISILAGVANAQNPALSIKDCIQIALKNNSELKNADRRTRLAGTGVTMARAEILPSLGVSLSSNRAYQSPQGPYLQEIPIQDPVTGQVTLVQQNIFLDSYYRNSFSSGASLNQMIFDGGKWFYRIKQANAGYNSAELNYHAIRAQVIALVTQHYYDLLKGIKLQEVYEKAVESAQEQLKKTESMYEIGSVAQADVFRARVNLGTEQMNLIQQRNIVAMNRADLNLALGWDVNHAIEILGEDLTIEPLQLTKEEVWNLVEEHNPSLKSLAENLKGDQYGIKIAKGNFLPQINLNASYGRYHTNFNKLYDPFDKNYSFSGRLSISWNLFNGMADAAGVEQASLNYHIDKENLLQNKLSLKNDAEQAYLSYKAYEEIEKINEDNLKSAEEDLRLSQERYRIGAGTLLEVIDAQVSLTRARATLITTKYNRLIVLVQLYNNAGILEDKLKSVME